MSDTRQPLPIPDGRIVCKKCGDDYVAGHFCDITSPKYHAWVIREKCDFLAYCVPVDVLAPLREYADSLRAR